MTEKPKREAKGVKPSTSPSPVKALKPKKTPLPIDVKRPAWRPSTYRPEFCDQVIEYGKLGYSIRKMATLLGACHDTVVNWGKVHPEFSGALEYARDLSQAFHEDFAQKYAEENPDGPRLNTVLYKFHMSGRFSDYRQKNDAPMQAQAVKITLETPAGIEISNKE